VTVLPVLLDAAQPDPLALLLQWGGLAMAGLLSLVCGLLALRDKDRKESTAKLSDQVEANRRAQELKNEAHDKKAHELEIKAENLHGRLGQVENKVENIQRGSIDQKYFDLATSSQNSVLNAATVTLDEIRRKVEDLERSKASRSDLVAARPYVKSPIPRDEAPSEPPQTPPPRAKLPTLGRHGAE
jgi:hypothetical protein